MFRPIRTSRLLIRPVRLDDAEALAVRRSDPRVAEFQNWSIPYSITDARALIAETIELGGPRPDAWWMMTVAAADDSAVYGDLALHLGWDGRAAEIGYTFAREHQGYGYAAEALHELVNWLWEDPRRTRVSARLHPDNAPSATLLERTGFVYEGLTRLSYWVGEVNSDDLLYGMTRDDWGRWQRRPRQAPATVQLEAISPETSLAVRQLETHHSQRRFASPVERSFADALFPEIVDGAPVHPWLRAVRADGDLVAFVMLALTSDHHPEPFLWRLLVDRYHQRRGIGRRVVDLVIAECARRGDTSLLTTWVEGRGGPRAFYERLGFVETGNIIDGETEARLTLG